MANISPYKSSYEDYNSTHNFIATLEAFNIYFLPVNVDEHIYDRIEWLSIIFKNSASKSLNNSNLIL
jgi:hypothetical protein